MAPHAGHSHDAAPPLETDLRHSLQSLKEWTNVLTILVFILVACACVVFFLQLFKLLQAVVDALVPKKKRSELKTARSKGKRSHKKSRSSKSGKKKKKLSKSSKSSKSSKAKASSSAASLSAKKTDKKSSAGALGLTPVGVPSQSNKAGGSTEKPVPAAVSADNVGGAKEGGSLSASSTQAAPPAAAQASPHTAVQIEGVTADASKSEKTSAASQTNNSTSKKLPSAEQLQKKEKLKALNDKKLLNPSMV